MNQYDSPIGRQYISTYVPQPLGMISDLAQNYSDRYYAGKALTDQIDLISQKVKNAPMHSQLKQDWITEHDKKMSDLVNSTRSSDYANPEFQNKATNIIKQAINDPRLSTINNTYNWWDKEGQKYVNSKEYNQNINLQNWKNPDGTWKQTNNDVQGIDRIEYANHIPDVKSIMDNISVDGTPISDIQKSNNGYFTIVNGKRKEISKDKVESIADANVENYAGTPGGKFRFADLLRRNGLDPSVKYEDFYNNSSLPSEVKEAGRNALKADLLNEGIKQVHKDIDYNQDLKADTMGALNGSGGLPQTASNPYDITDITKEMDPSIKKGFTIDNEGKVHFDINKLSTSKWERAAKNPGLAGIMVALGDVKPSDKQLQDLSKEAVNAAQSIGYKGKIIPTGKTKRDPKTGEITNMNYDDLFTEYLKYSKMLSPLEKLTDVDSKYYTQDIIGDRQNYTFKDQDGKILSDKDVPYLKSDNFTATSRTTKDHNTQILANHIDPETGEVTRYVIEPHSIQHQIFHSISGGIKEDANTFFTTGKVNEASKPYINMSKNLFKDSDISIPKGTEIINYTPMPGQSDHAIVTFSGKENRKTILPFIVKLGLDPSKKDKEGNPVPIILGQKQIEGGLNGLIQTLSTRWYQTPEGKQEAASQLKNDKLFKFMTQEDNNGQ